MDQGNEIDCIYLDFSKVFDSVPYQRLIKLRNYEIPNKPLSWIRDFLPGRKELVTVNGPMSKVADVLGGVPQGSMLGPLFFICFC